MSVVASYQDPARLLPKSGSARAAILLIALGASGAARILRHFSPEEIRRLKESAATLASVAPEAIEDLVDAFQDAFRKAPGLDGPARQMTELLQGALGEEEFQSLFSRDGETPDDAAGASDAGLWAAVADVKSDVLASKLSREHPQVVAVLLAKIPAETASAIVRAFDQAFRHAVMGRMMSLKPLSDPVLSRFERYVRQAYLGGTQTSEETGSHQALAEIVNRLDKEQADLLIAAMERATPRDAEALKKLLFAFEDIEALSQKARLVLFDAVPGETVIMALRGTDASMREAVLSALGARARRMIEAELSQDAAAAPAEIDGARRRIAAEALRLSADGRLQLRSEGEA